MTLFLQASCGSVQLLIDVTQVVEVVDVPVSSRLSTVTMVEHCSWREQILPRINMHCYFTMPDPGVSRLIVVDSGLADANVSLVALAVESCDSLLALDAAGITDIADQHDNLASVFAGIYSPADAATCQLLLRFPATWLLPLLTGEAVA